MVRLVSNYRNLISPLFALTFGLLWVFQLAPAIHWLDGPILTLAGVSLSISHPPGHVLHALWVKAFSVLPLGHLAFRAHLSSWAAMVIATGIWIKWFEQRQSKQEGLHSLIEILLLSSFFLSLLWAAPSFRTEIYPLQLLLLTVAFYLKDLKARDCRHNYLSAFFFGLALTLHPLIALISLPIFLSQTFIRSLGFLVLAAAPLMYLPLRSGLGTFFFGHLKSFESLFWFLSGKLYHAYDAGVSVPFWENLASYLEVLTFESGIVLIPMAFVGIALALSHGRRQVLQTLLVFFLSCIAIAGMGNFYPENPDVRGYSLFPLVLLLATGLSSFVQIFHSERHRIFLGLQLGFGVVLVCAMSFTTWIYGDVRKDWSAHWHVSSLWREIPLAGQVSLGSFATYTLMEQSRVLEGKRGDLSIVYRGIPGGIGAVGSVGYPNVVGPIRAWEWSVAKQKNGNWRLREYGETFTQGFKPTGWFYSRRKNYSSAWIQSWSRDREHTLAFMGQGANYGKEALILNYLLHLIWLREEGLEADEKLLREEGNRLFPLLSEEGVFKN